MRLLFVLPFTLLAACSTATPGLPSLAPRPAEAIDPRVPVVLEPDTSPASPELVRQLDELVAQAVAGDAAFREAAERADRLASAAGAAQSESWVLAQQALSAAVSSRWPVTRAVAEVDAIGARQIQAAGAIGAADFAAIKAAAAKIGDIDAREASTIEAIQARLGR